MTSIYIGRRQKCDGKYCGPGLVENKSIIDIYTLAGSFFFSSALKSNLFALEIQNVFITLKLGKLKWAIKDRPNIARCVTGSCFDSLDVFF